MNDDFDEFGSEEIDDTLIDNQEIDNQEEGFVDEEQTPKEESDFISEFLKLNGIEDKSKIKFEDENGELQEVNWDNLTNSDRINMIKSFNGESDLDDSEIELINAIRGSKMTPSEYLNHVSKTSIDNYIHNNNSNTVSYKVDDYSDDDLYMYDLLIRFPDLTDEEVKEALEQEKSNSVLFSKKMEALRNGYKQSEQEEIQRIEFEQQQAQQEQYEQFSSSIRDQIINFNDFFGCEVNMDQDEMQELHEFITGFDGAGNNHFAKVLNDPNLVVKMAFSLLNGERLVEDINSYYKNEIAKVRKASYEKGVEDAKNKKVVIKKTNSKSDYFDSEEF